MSDHRRTVRASADFFADLDRQLPAVRGPAGEPCVNDFQVFELIRIIEHFATEFDRLPELFPGRPDYRILIAAGTLVPRFAVIGCSPPMAPLSSSNWTSITTRDSEPAGHTRRRQIRGATSVS